MNANECERAIRQVVYVSNARDDIGIDEIKELLKEAIRNNEKHGIGGMLVYRDGKFIQAIEGESSEIKQLLNNLQKDTRHNGLKIILDHKIVERDFPVWVMGFKNLTDSELCNDLAVFEVSDIVDTEDPTTAMKILKRFAL